VWSPALARISDSTAASHGQRAVGVLGQVLLGAVQVVQRRGEAAVGGGDERDVSKRGGGLVVVAGFACARPRPGSASSAAGATVISCARTAAGPRGRPV
jgi:hypothetical protein